MCDGCTHTDGITEAFLLYFLHNDLQWDIDLGHHGHIFCFEVVPRSWFSFHGSLSPGNNIGEDTVKGFNLAVLKFRGFLDGYLPRWF